MLQRERVARLVRQLRALSTHDAERLQKAKDSLAAAEEEFAAAEERAAASQQAAQAAETYLRGFTSDMADQAPSTASVPAEQRQTVVELIREFVAERGRATTLEIIQHVDAARPDTGRSGVSPELTRLVKNGTLTRPQQGVYAIAAGSSSKEGHRE
ncbi:type IV toxin-antitoxin system AbiEi family antitoxin domain-containing protein [Streptomyces sp. NPDC054933]